ncbi:hypothetical protein [Microbispora sp. H10885]|uniref:hypothetical protein n=1 Tax=Microbispora sp. H10885 TaxID=2729110 RepID=UPI0016047F03|nr:hypothetical protein [Microbispora sp. H10885]
MTSTMPPNVTRLYQAVLRDVRAPISIRLRRVFSEWAAEKGFPAANPGSPLTEHEVNGSRLRMERRGDCGRYILDEPCDGGVLQTRVIYAESVPGMTGWVMVTADQRGHGAPLSAQAPGFVPAYLRTARITDGAVHLEDSPLVVDEEEVDRFLHTLAEPRRRVPVVVVSVDSSSSDAAPSRARYLSAATAGVALVARFGDLRTQDRFNQVMGHELGVFGGGIRTYLAPFDPAAERYPYRHRPMGGGMIRNEGDRALDKAIEGVIGATAYMSLPDEVIATLRVVNRVLAGRSELREIAEAVHSARAVADPAREELRRRMMAKTVRPAPAIVIEDSRTEIASQSPSAEPEAPQRENAEASVPAPDPSELAQSVAESVVKELRADLESALSLAATSGPLVDESHGVSRQLAVLTAHVAGLRDIVGARCGNEEPLHVTGSDAERLIGELETLRAEHKVLLGEYEEAVSDIRRMTERVRHLERKLAETGQSVYGIALGDDLFEPASLMETLIEARQRLTHVVIGDTDAAATRLDLHHPALSRIWAAKAWDALRALDDFARARSSCQFAGGFYDWCATGSADRLTIPVGMLSMRESQSVANRPKFSAPRTFAVPREVDPSGRLLMEAHVKLRPVGYPAPRLYFHDDSGGATGKIWVGYVGDHLPNTRTN